MGTADGENVTGAYVSPAEDGPGVAGAFIWVGIGLILGLEEEGPKLGIKLDGVNVGATLGAKVSPDVVGPRVVGMYVGVAVVGVADCTAVGPAVGHGDGVMLVGTSIGATVVGENV